MHYTSKEVYEHISHQTNDPIVERKTCTVSGQEFPIFQSDIEFYNKISPTFAGQKFQVPTPKLCPEERQRRRLLFRNERKLYKRKCDATGDTIISIYSPDKPYKVYKQDFWWSDKRSPMDYGQDFDFSKSFAENIKTLLLQVPLLGLNVISNENADYVNYCGYSKNCYMSFISDYSENILYGHENIRSNNCTDCTKVVDCSYCYNTHIAYDCYKVNNSYHVFNCKESINLQYCQNCNFCINCSNLINKDYYINNKPSTKEEYLKHYNSPQKSNQETIYPTRNLIQNEGFISGDFIRNSKGVELSIDITNGINVKYSSKVRDIHDCYDRDYTGYKGTLNYELCSCGDNINNSATCFNIWSGGVNCYQCFLGIGIADCFGCVGLRNKSYCILNKQYTKEEYELTVSKIISHMQETGERGEFFHPSLSPFGYNETVANEYFPLSRSEALNFPLGSEANPLGQGRGGGLKRQDNNYDPTIPEGAKVVEGDQIESLNSDEEILKSIFICEVSKRPYRIIKQELEFYRKHHLPLPRKHPDIRHEERMKLRPGRTLYLRNCNCCNKEMLSVYAPKEVTKGNPVKDLLGEASDHSGTIYCEECYQKEIYS